MNQESEDDKHLDLKLALLMVLVNFHYAIVAYNHTSPTFINYTPPFYCENAAKEKVFGCETNKTEMDEFCPNGYNFDTHEGETTIITEWNLVCENNYYGPLTTTIYMSGVTLGALSTGFLSDMLGRKPVIVMCLYVQAVIGVCISMFIYSFPLYMIVRAIQGFFVQGLQGGTYTLLIEIIPKKHHTLVGVAAGVYWAFGLVILSGVAYAFPQWRHIQLVLSVMPVFFSLLYVWFLPESKKWLTLYNPTDKSGQERDESKELENIQDSRENQLVLTTQGPLQTIQKAFCSDKSSDSSSVSLSDVSLQNQQVATTNDESLSRSSNVCDTAKINKSASKHGCSACETRQCDNINCGHRNDETSSVQIVAARAREESSNLQHRSDHETVNTGHSALHELQLKGGAGNITNKSRITVFRSLWSISVLRKYLMVMIIVWFSTSLSYYGVTFNLPTLSGDRYINFLLGAVLEAIAYTAAYFFLSHGRRLPLFYSLLIGGILCITAGLIPQTSSDYNWAGPTKTALALIGKGTVVIVFCAIYLYTSELFPTGVRAAVIGFCGFSSRVGSLLSPQLLYLINYTNAAMPFLVMGTCEVVSSVLVLALPETHGCPLPNTVEDTINIGKKKKLQSDTPTRNETETNSA